MYTESHYLVMGDRILEAIKECDEDLGALHLSPPRLPTVLSVDPPAEQINRESGVKARFSRTWVMANMLRPRE